MFMSVLTRTYGLFDHFFVRWHSVSFVELRTVLTWTSSSFLYLAQEKLQAYINPAPNHNQNPSTTTQFSTMATDMRKPGTLRPAQGPVSANGAQVRA